VDQGELERKAATQSVKALAEEERAARMSAEADHAAAAEAERAANQKAALSAMDAERAERLSAEAKRGAASSEAGRPPRAPREDIPP
jgi:hypothetical protein